VFASGALGRYDLVVGADGVHSAVRRLAFGPDPRFTVHMGSAMAIGTIPNALGLVREQLSCNDVERVATIKSANGDAELKVCLFFRSKLAAFDSEDVSAQKRQLTEAFAGASWRLPEIARMVADAPDFYAAPTCQIRMARHYAGRAVLVGDAGYCPSPLAGQGTSLALVGAYVLVRAVSQTNDIPAALARYDASLRSFVVKNQDLAKKIGGGFVASSRFELAVRNAMMRALAYMPASGFLISQAMRGVRVAANAIELPAP
jgi:2-polyprenyl-6-methoxyphenol hydroxylase-like FAD-dependent oxidoreductase